MTIISCHIRSFSWIILFVLTLSFFRVSWCHCPVNTIDRSTFCPLPSGFITYGSNLILQNIACTNMPFPLPPQSQAEKEQRLKRLPSGPLPEPKGYTLVGTYDVKTQDMHAICRSKGVTCKHTDYTVSAYERSYQCKNKGCTYRMKSIQNAERGALYEKGQHNHGERGKRVNESATITSNVPAPSKTPRQPISQGVGQRQKQKGVKTWKNPSQAAKEERLKSLPSGFPRKPWDKEYVLIGTYDVNTVDLHAICLGKGVYCYQTAYTAMSYDRYYRCKVKNCTYRVTSIQNSEQGVVYTKGQHNHVERGNLVNGVATIASNVPASSKARRQPITRGIGQRQKQKSVKKWKIRTLFKNFEALVNHLMANGVTPYRQPSFKNGKIKRIYRCRHCNYVALSLRGDNPFKKCVLFETRKHRHKTTPVSPDALHLYLEEPDPLPRRLPPGTVITIDSDDECADGGEGNEDAMDTAPTAIDHADSHVTATPAVKRCNAPLVDYPDSDDEMETDSHVTDKTAATTAPKSVKKATVAAPAGRVAEIVTAEENKIITSIDALCQLFQYRAKVANLNATTEARQNTVNASHDLIREAFGDIDPSFKGYEDLKKMIYKVIPDAPKPPRRRKQDRPMKVECIPAHGALSVWMARLRRLQNAVDEFVNQTREERHQRKQNPTSSTRL